VWVALALGLMLGAAAWFLGGGWAALPSSTRWDLTQYFFNEPDQALRIAAYLRAPGAGSAIAEYAWRVHESFWGSFGWQVLGPFLQSAVRESSGPDSRVT
jgi:hypothetical protein